MQIREKRNLTENSFLAAPTMMKTLECVLRRQVLITRRSLRRRRLSIAADSLIEPFFRRRTRSYLPNLPLQLGRLGVTHRVVEAAQSDPR